MIAKHLYKFIAFCICLFPTLVFSQDLDSLQIVQANWNKKEIKKGVIWHQGHFDNLFNGVQEINWVEIDLKKHKKHIHIAGDSSKLKPTSLFAEENNALIAINASFFDMKNGGSVDFIKVDNQLINKGNKPSERANAIFSISKKDIKIEKSSQEATVESKAHSILQAGPLLIEGNKYVQLEKNPFNDNRHPRTAIAITNKDKLILLVVDGRNSQAYGMNLIELSKIFKWLGAKDAMNLDGGGSSTLYIKDASPNSIVNYPSDNKKFDNEGQRSVANIIYFK